MELQESSNAGMSDEEILNEIKACHSKSISFASKAVAEDEQNNTNEAMSYYLKSLRHCEAGIRFYIHNTRYSGRDWDMARDMQQGMISTLENVRQRIYQLQSYETGNDGLPRSENPPPYSVEDPRRPDLNQASSSPYNDVSAEPLLIIESGVQMYFVSSEQNVGIAPPSYPTSLKVLRIKDEFLQSPGPQAILQVGDWLYPLAKDHMPVLHSANGAYIFPNCTTDGIQEGSAVGIVISNEVAREYVEMFESILHNYAVFQAEDRDDGFVDLTEFVQPPSEEMQQLANSPRNQSSHMSDRLAQSLASGAEALGEGVKKSAEYASEMIELGSQKLTSTLVPNENPLTVNPVVQKGLYYSYEASKMTVRVSQWLVNWLCAITNRVGEQISPYLNPQPAITNSESATNGNASNVNGLFKVAKAGLAGIGKVWLELEKAGSSIAQAVTSATVKNVELKYGPQAGEAANLAMGAAVNLGTTAFTLDNLGMKTVAEVTAKDEQPEASHVQSTETIERENRCPEEKGRD